MPLGIQRRPISKRRSAERQPSSQISPSKVGKGAGDANIVPPISVLIVDGERFEYHCPHLEGCELRFRVSDNPINQTILSTFMKKKQIKYDVAKNGQEAVQKWRTGGFHLILVSRRKV
jgi:osomolarity two-component system response regulator SSK1